MSCVVILHQPCVVICHLSRVVISHRPRVVICHFRSEFHFLKLVAPGIFLSSCSSTSLCNSSMALPYSISLLYSSFLGRPSSSSVVRCSASCSEASSPSLVTYLCTFCIVSACVQLYVEAISIRRNLCYLVVTRHTIWIHLLQLHLLLGSLVRNAAKVGFDVNKDKTIRIDCQTTDPVKLGEQDIEDVTEFTYLGAKVTKDGNTEAEIKTTISKARGAFAALKIIWKKTKIRIFKSNVLLYAAYFWKMRNMPHAGIIPRQVP